MENPSCKTNWSRRALGRYPITGVEFDRRGGGVGHASASDRSDRSSALGNAVNVVFWHKGDVQSLAVLGPLTGALPTFGVQCRLIFRIPTAPALPAPLAPLCPPPPLRTAMSAARRFRAPL